ncbi:MAG: hypothetical protein M3014_13450 [Chloroflexota bacterium]|nr:hypothetical protein [Chloroflexota bacterium]
MIAKSHNNSAAILLLAALIVSLSALAGCGPESPTATPVTSPAPTLAPSPGTVITVTLPSVTVQAADTSVAGFTPTSVAILAASATVAGPAQTATPELTSTPVVQASPTMTNSPTPVPTVILDYTLSKIALSGKNITSMALVPGGGNSVLVGGTQGVWLGTYPYTQWEPLKVQLGGKVAEVAAGSPQVFYLTSHTGCASGLPVVRSRSVDAGKTWVSMTGNAVTIEAANGTVAYGTTCEGSLTKSEDAGATWRVLPTSKVSDYDPRSVAVSPDGQTVYGAFVSEGGSGKIMRSIDGGSTWLEVTPKLEGDSILQAPTNLTYVTGTEGRPQDAGLYMTSFEGLWFLPADSSDWKKLTKPGGLSPGESYSWFPSFYVDTTYSEPVIYTSRAKPGTGPEGLGIYRSTDNGQTWATIVKGLAKHIASSMIIVTSDKPTVAQTLLAGTDDGIWSVALQSGK